LLLYFTMHITNRRNQSIDLVTGRQPANPSSNQDKLACVPKSIPPLRKSIETANCQSDQIQPLKQPYLLNATRKVNKAGSGQVEKQILHRLRRILIRARLCLSQVQSSQTEPDTCMP